MADADLPFFFPHDGAQNETSWNTRTGPADRDCRLNHRRDSPLAVRGSTAKKAAVVLVAPERLVPPVHPITDRHGVDMAVEPERRPGPLSQLDQEVRPPGEDLLDVVGDPFAVEHLAEASDRLRLPLRMQTGDCGN